VCAVCVCVCVVVYSYGQKIKKGQYLPKFHTSGVGLCALLLVQTKDPDYYNRSLASFATALTPRWTAIAVSFEIVWDIRCPQ
jgi:hypothetical protein